MKPTANNQRTQQIRSSALCLGVALILAAILAASAQAAPVTIAKFGTGAGQVKTPLGISVEQSSGHLYVADSENFRVDKFDSAGNFLLAFGYGVADGTSQTLQTCGPEASPPTSGCFPGQNFSGTMRPQDVVVDQSSGDLYVADPSSHRVLEFTSSGQLVFMVGKNVNKTKVAEGGATQAEKDFCAAASADTCGTGESGTGPNEFAKPLSLAIEESGPTAGRLWVGDVNRLVAIDSGGTPGPEAALPGTGVTGSLAVDSAGDFYIVRAGAIESQVLDFSGFTKGDTFSLGNLPASCSDSQTDSITYFNHTFESNEFSAAEQVALEEKCGDAILPFSTGLYFINQLVAQDIGQLTCTPISGGGNCSVSTVQNGAQGTVEKRDSSGALLETLYTGAPEALTLDAAGNLYIGDRRGKYHFAVLDPTGDITSVFGAGQVKVSTSGVVERGSGPRGNALALDEGSGTLYAANTLIEQEGAVQAFPLPEPGPLPENQRVEDLLPTTATLAAELNPEGHETTYRFEYGTSASYGESTPTQTLAGEGFDSEPVAASLEGLIPDTPYHFRLVATNHCNPSEPAEECTVAGPDTTFTTRPAVAIGSPWATDITARTATLNAELDPLGVVGEWWLEYGTSVAYGTSIAHSTLPASFGEIGVSVPLTGLQADTTYHYRFVARDERDGVTYTVHGVDRSFATEFGGVGFDLADDRAWELVSPPDKHGARLLGRGEFHLQASVDGNGFTYASLQSTEANPDGSRTLEASTNLARRKPGGSWRSKDITSPNDRVTPVLAGQGSEFKLFSPDLSRAVLDPRSGTPLSSEASERAPYLRENTEPAAYTPLVTGKEGFANVAPGVEFGGGETLLSAVTIQSATPDLSHVVMTSRVPLVENAPTQTIYEWSDGVLAPIGVLPDAEGGEIVPAQLGSGSASIRHAISSDGSRVFWSGIAPGSHLYMREMDTEETVRVDVVSSGFGPGSVAPVFQGASEDGRVVFFTDTHRLTEDASSGGADLYRCEILEPAAGCVNLIDITAPPSGSEESADVQGMLSALSTDGSRAYFVAEGVLDTEANQFGHVAVGGSPNLYIWEMGEGVRFIATLTTEDRGAWGRPGTVAAPGKVSALSAASSPDGRIFAFMSERRLTDPEDPTALNLDPSSGEAVESVFRYDADSGRLDCISCPPTGAVPEGALIESGQTLVDPIGQWTGRRAAAFLPQAIQINLGGITAYQPRSVMESGRIFFNAADSLVPADSNGQWDVYQYEPIGVGDCSSSSGSAGIARSADGCVSLLSSGTAEEDAGFLDASETGDDVFFITSAQLNETDQDQELDIYDARVDGVPARLPSLSECLGEACQPSAQSPNDPTPASASLRGAGNLKQGARRRCGKGRKAVRRGGRMRCVAKHRKREGRAHRRQKRARHGRSAQR